MGRTYRTKLRERGLTGGPWEFHCTNLVEGSVSWSSTVGNPDAVLLFRVVAFGDGAGRRSPVDLHPARRAARTPRSPPRRGWRRTLRYRRRRIHAPPLRRHRPTGARCGPRRGLPRHARANPGKPARNGHGATRGWWRGGSRVGRWRGG
jgi:hypothetical protein